MFSHIHTKKRHCVHLFLLQIHQLYKFSKEKSIYKFSKEKSIFIELGLISVAHFKGNCSILGI
jgi:hypothetical protein